MNLPARVSIYRDLLPALLGAGVIIWGIAQESAAVMALGAGLLGTPALIPTKADPGEEPDTPDQPPVNLPAQRRDERLGTETYVDDDDDDL